MDLSEFYEKPGKLCAVGRFLSTLDPDERDVFAEASRQDDITHASLIRWLLKRGFKSSDKTVVYHRIEKCCCND